MAKVGNKVTMTQEEAERGYQLLCKDYGLSPLRSRGERREQMRTLPQQIRHRVGMRYCPDAPTNSEHIRFIMDIADAHSNLAGLMPE